MALARDFKETVQTRARREAAFRRALLEEGVRSLLAGEVEVKARFMGGCRHPEYCPGLTVATEGNRPGPPLETIGRLR